MKWPARQPPSSRVPSLRFLYRSTSFLTQVSALLAHRLKSVGAPQSDFRALAQLINRGHRLRKAVEAIFFLKLLADTSFRRATPRRECPRACAPARPLQRGARAVSPPRGARVSSAGRLLIGFGCAPPTPLAPAASGSMPSLLW